MTWIEPLELQTWLIQVFAGSPDIFLAVALFVISLGSAFFRMSYLATFLMMGIFVLMFSQYLGNGLIGVFAIISGLVIGYFLSRFIIR